jgi:hypothetical protein
MKILASNDAFWEQATKLIQKAYSQFGQVQAVMLIPRLVEVIMAEAEWEEFSLCAVPTKVPYLSDRFTCKWYLDVYEYTLEIGDTIYTIERYSQGAHDPYFHLAFSTLVVSGTNWSAALEFSVDNDWESKFLDNLVTLSDLRLYGDIYMMSDELLMFKLVEGDMAPVKIT